MTEKYERLTIIEEVGRTKWGAKLVKCKCDCGNEIIVEMQSLKAGKTRSCGCLLKENLEETKRKSIIKTTKKYKKEIGKKKDKLTIKDVFFDENLRRHCFVCDCDCGNEYIIRVDNFKSHKKLSCGCGRHYLRDDKIHKKTVISQIKNNKLPKNNTSGVRGVSYRTKDKLWVAQLKNNGITYQKVFHSKNEAIAYRNYLYDKYHKPRVAGIKKTKEKKPKDA